MVFPGAFQGDDLFSSLAETVDWVKGRDRTKQRGRSLGVPRVHVHMRMGMAQLSGHIREGGAGYCSRSCGGLMSLP